MRPRGVRRSNRPLPLGQFLISAPWLAVLFVASSVLAAPERRPWTMAFRIAAHPELDAEIVALAKAPDAREIRKDGQLVASWYPVAANAPQDLAEGGLPLVTRARPDGVVEVLVLAGAWDVTHSDVEHIFPGRDVLGRPAIGVGFTEAGAKRLGMLTGKNRGRHLALMMEGELYGVPVIRATVYDTAHITGAFTQEMIDDISIRFQGFAYDAAEDGGLRLTTWHLAGAIAALLVLPLGAWPTRGARISRAWLITAALIGSAIGGYWLGVSTHCGTAKIGGGLSAIQKTTVISLLWLSVGGLVGAAAGLVTGYMSNRAAHNVWRIFGRLRARP